MVLESSIYWNNKRVKLIFKQSEMSETQSYGAIGDMIVGLFNLARDTGRTIGATAAHLWNEHRKNKEEQAEQAQAAELQAGDDKAKTVVDTYNDLQKQRTKKLTPEDKEKNWNRIFKEVNKAAKAQREGQKIEPIRINANTGGPTQDEYEEAKKRRKGIPLRKAKDIYQKGKKFGIEYYKGNKTAFKEAGKDIFHTLLYSKLQGAKTGEALGQALLSGYETFVATPHEETSYERMERRRRELGETFKREADKFLKTDTFNAI